MDPRTGIDLQQLADDLLQRAHQAPAGRAAASLLAGSENALAQTMLVVVAGSSLDDHVAPGQATLQVLRGSGRLGCAGREVALEPNRWVTVPAERHRVDADTDLVTLLTVSRPDHGST